MGKARKFWEAFSDVPPSQPESSKGDSKDGGKKEDKKKEDGDEKHLPPR